IRTHTLFNYKFSPKWITPAVATALTGIDKGVYVSDTLFRVEFLGYIPHELLSGGFKTLACIRNINLDDWVDTDGKVHKGESWCYPASYMGANVFPFLGAVLDEIDWDINLDWGTSVFPKQWGDAKVDIQVMETGKHCSTWKEFGEYAYSNPELLRTDVGEGF
ncbi:MAG: hypothetical protein RSC68_25860, partial [Acinetobacter sp.]